MRFFDEMRREGVRQFHVEHRDQLVGRFRRLEQAVGVAEAHAGMQVPFGYKADLRVDIRNSTKHEAPEDVIVKGLILWSGGKRLCRLCEKVLLNIASERSGRQSWKQMSWLQWTDG